MEIEIIKLGKEYDHDRVYWLDDTGKRIGLGYRGKKKRSIGLIRCPRCLKENYAINVSLGICTWCGFDANNTI